MNIDTNDLSTLTPEDWGHVLTSVQREQTRRDAILNTASRVQDIVNVYQFAVGVHQEQGVAWVEPTSYLDAYPLGFEVTHGGKTWVSLRNGASGEPGVVTGDWQEKQVEGQYTAWVQPQAGSEYPVGALVTHNGHRWRNDHSGPNGWEPGTTGSQWTDLGNV